MDAIRSRIRHTRRLQRQSSAQLVDADAFLSASARSLNRRRKDEAIGSAVRRSTGKLSQKEYCDITQLQTERDSAQLKRKYDGFKGQLQTERHSAQLKRKYDGFNGQLQTERDSAQLKRKHDGFNGQLQIGHDGVKTLSQSERDGFSGSDVESRNNEMDKGDGVKSRWKWMKAQLKAIRPDAAVERQVRMLRLGDECASVSLSENILEVSFRYLICIYLYT